MFLSEVRIGASPTCGSLGDFRFRGQSGHHFNLPGCPLLTDPKRTSAILLQIRHCATANGYVVCLSSCLNAGFAEAAGDIR